MIFFLSTSTLILLLQTSFIPNLNEFQFAPFEETDDRLISFFQSETVPDDQILGHLVEEFDLLKMYWNTSWFGVDGALNSREGEPFSDKLMLDKKDQLLLQLSFPQTGVLFCIESKIRKARDHSQFHDGKK